MKHTLFLSMMAAALLGGQVFAEPLVYRVSDCAGAAIEPEDSEATIIVDAQKTIFLLEAFESPSLTLDYQGDYVLTSSSLINMPNEGVLNITSTVSSVATAWEDAFSVEGGSSITICKASGSIDGSSFATVQFFGKEANNTVQLGESEVKFMGIVEALSNLDMNQVGIVWGEHDMLLVGKVVKSVPEPTTGTLSLLALAGLCIRRRK